MVYTPELGKKSESSCIERPLLREMLVWMVKDGERKLGGIERPLLREMNVLMLKDAEQKPGGVERPLL